VLFVKGVKLQTRQLDVLPNPENHEPQIKKTSESFQLAFLFFGSGGFDSNWRAQAIDKPTDVD